MWLFHALTIRNDHHGESAEHFQGSHHPSVPFRGDLYVEECGEGEHFGVLNIFLSLEGKGNGNCSIINRNQTEIEFWWTNEQSIRRE